MIRRVVLFVLALCLVSALQGCAGCDDSDDDGGVDAGDTAILDSSGEDTSDNEDAGDTADAATDSGDDTATDDASDGSDGDTGDTGDTADTSDATDADEDTEDAADADDDTSDTATMDSGQDTAGDTDADSGGDTSTSTCGNGTIEGNETCDDGVTSDCTGTHDGGDGTCVAQGTCSSGYSLDSNGDCVSNPTGLSTPCQNGSGWTLFRFHYDSLSTSPRIDVWDATCTYSYGNQACNVQEITSGFYDIDRTSDGYPIVTSSREWLRARFSVSGLSFSSATVHIQGRSYSSFTTTDARVESPLYGARTVGPIDQDFTYDWYTLDWTGYLKPTDDPGLTAIEIFADGGSSELAVKAVELCVE